MLLTPEQQAQAEALLEAQRERQQTARANTPSEE
jgi:hypothetical protein